MFKIKDTESKKTAAKRSITVENVMINEDGILCDEDGSIAPAIADALPEGVNLFTIKIAIELSDEEDSDEE